MAHSYAVFLIAAVVFGLASFIIAQSFRQSNGQNLWGMHPAIWGVIGFAVGILGFILCLIARFTTKPRRPGEPDPSYPPVGYGQNPYGAPPPYGAQPPYGQPGPGPYGTPGPYDAAPTTQPAPAPSAGYPPAAAYQPSTYPAQPAAPPGNPPAEWYADPSGKHTHRYWNGTAWTEHVADNGVSGIDPVPSGAQGTRGAAPVDPS